MSIGLFSADDRAVIAKSCGVAAPSNELLERFLASALAQADERFRIESSAYAEAVAQYKQAAATFDEQAERYLELKHQFEIDAAKYDAALHAYLIAKRAGEDVKAPVRPDPPQAPQAPVDPGPAPAEPTPAQACAALIVNMRAGLERS